MRFLKSGFRFRPQILLRSLAFRICLCNAVLRWLDRHRADVPLGQRGELAAERFFLKLGYWIIERGFGEKTGEIDLIVSDGSAVVFVEVKTRRSDRFGDPTEAVDLTKQRHICQTARLFAVKNDIQESPLRFDVVSVIWSDEKQLPCIRHFPNAFEATGNFQIF